MENFKENPENQSGKQPETPEDIPRKTLENAVGDIKPTAEETIRKRIEEKVGEPTPTIEDKIKKAIEDAVDKALSTKDGDSGETQTDKPETLEELIAKYIEDLKNNSEYPETITYNGEKYEKRTPEETAKKREEFEDKDSPNYKERLKEQWEKENGREWPKYEEDVRDEKTGKIIRRKGDDYDAHHIHPLSLGGENTAKNITPMHANKHYDCRGVHAPDSPYAQLNKQCIENKKEETQ